MTDKMSEIECKILKAQIERRAKFRKQFLKERTNPYKHSKDLGHVFDNSLQRWMSMKACQLDHFYANKRTIPMAVASIIPMFLYGYLLYQQRSQFEQDCRCGKLRYRDRPFKLH